MNLPPQFKILQPFMRLGEEHKTRDPVIYYYCKLYVLQEGMKIDKNSTDSLNFLMNLMDELEKFKKANKNNEASTNDIVGQAYIEAYALKLFVFADTEDRNSHFNKNVVKAFFSSSILFEVLQIFGTLSDEVIQQKKYAKWKATYINDCLKKNILPNPGPPENSIDFSDPPPLQSQNKSINEEDHSSFGNGFQVSGKNKDTQDAHSRYNPISTPSNINQTQISQVQLDGMDPLELANAEKLCKYAHSALQYQDIPTAINNLKNCLKILEKINSTDSHI